MKPEALEDYQGLMYVVFCYDKYMYSFLNSAENYSKIAGDPENKVNLVGSWNTIIGTLDQAIHIWEYRGYPGFHHTQRRLQASAEFQRFQRQLAPMLRERKNEICLEFAFWLTSPPNEHGKVYELRTYQLKVIFVIIYPNRIINISLDDC